MTRLTAGTILLHTASLMGCRESVQYIHPDRAGMEEQRRCSVQADHVVKKFEQDTGHYSINPQNHLDPRSGICTVSI